MMKKTIMSMALLAGFAAAGDTEFNAGAWRVEFKPDDARLTLTHAASGAVIDGALKFMGPAHAEDAKAAPDTEWQILDSRDGVPNRLALVNPRNGDGNGYIAFQANGECVSLLVYHRTAVAFQGALSFAGTVKGRADAFACSTVPRPGERVLQLASGDADSLRNNTLFSTANDEALQLLAPQISLTSQGAGAWNFAMTLCIDDAASAMCAFNVVRDYYKDRWVPYYAPIDKSRSPRPPTGWMSWNVYFDKAGSKENLAEARLGQKYFQPFGMEFWSIESWQENSSELPVSKFYNMNLETHPEQFPEGMKWLADEIKALGFRPGLWTAPFGTGNKAFYEAHKDWFLHDANGKPISCWNGRYTLDPTVPEAREHLKQIHDRAAHEWGYEFFKIDGMSGRNSGYCAHLYERPEIRARFKDPSCPNPFELCVKAYREGIGPDRVFLACQGHFTGAEAAYADASRTGADIVHPNQPVGWANLLLQARCTINQIFTHGIVFWADPDCMLVNTALGIEQARVETTIVSLPGQQMFAGDKLAELPAERIKLIQQALPVAEVRPANLYPAYGHLPVWNLNVKRPFGSWHVVALFNWDDDAHEVGFDWTEIGEAPERAFAAWEFWTGSWLGINQGSFAMTVPARSVRLIALQPDMGRPQFLTSDRHVTQGAVELKDTVWRENTLTSTVNVIGGFPMTARFLIPSGYTLKGVEVPAGVTAETSVEAGGLVLAVKLSAATTTDVPVKLTF